MSHAIAVNEITVCTLPFILTRKGESESPSLCSPETLAYVHRRHEGVVAVEVKDVELIRRAGHGLFDQTVVPVELVVLYCVLFNAACDRHMRSMRNRAETAKLRFTKCRKRTHKQDYFFSKHVRT